MSKVQKTVLSEISDQNLPLVALVGRPNVGKSTLFNRLTRSRRAIVDPTPGMTRDRLYGTVDDDQYAFRVVDTGGIEEDPDLIATGIKKQSFSAIQEADLLVFLLDGREGLLASDLTIVEALRKSNKPTIVFVNKIDGGPDQVFDAEVFGLGLGPVLVGSAEHNHGMPDLINEIETTLGTSERLISDEEESQPLRIAIVGKPNAGKSSLINKLLNEERVMVSPIAGTTRDPIDTFFTFKDRDYCLIDTAGIRRKGKIEGSQEHLSVMMAKRQVEDADVIIMLMDAEDPGTQQDAVIAGIAHEALKPVIVAVNKWDLVPDKKTETPKLFESKIRRKMKFLEGCPFVFISALTGQRVSKVIDLAEKLHEKTRNRVPTHKVNQLLEYLKHKKALPSYRGRLTKIFYMTQVETSPPTFVAVINRKPPLHFSQERFLINRIRETFDFEGIPIKLIFRMRSGRDRD